MEGYPVPLNPHATWVHMTSLWNPTKKSLLENVAKFILIIGFLTKGVQATLGKINLEYHLETIFRKSPIYSSSPLGVMLSRNETKPLKGGSVMCTRCLGEVAKRIDMT